MDMFGPLFLKNGSKVYGLAIICNSTRAVKLAVLHNASGHELWEASFSIWNQVGFPRKVINDNGTNFVYVKNKLEEKFDSGEGFKVDWKLSTPGAP